jgi:hypothetical protein
MRPGFGSIWIWLGKNLDFLRRPFQSSLMARRAKIRPGRQLWSGEREIPGKTSQAFQLDEKSAAEPFDILRDCFHFR